MQAMKRVLALSAFLSLPLVLPAWAVSPATVTAVQAPAWLERAGHVQPLAVGMAIENGDRIRTGEDARAQLALAEGSTVKLGADARLAFFSMSAKPQKQYKGALDVVNGAFRFTTDSAKRVKSREVMIRVGSLTAGVYGTDVWGQSESKEDVVCLIEGRLAVWHTIMSRTVAMAQPTTCIAAPKGQSPKPMAAVDAGEFADRARQTEIERGSGATRAGGKLALTLGRYANEGEALEQYDIARSAGFAVSIMPVAAESGGWNYQLVAAGFPNEEEAAAAAARLKEATGIEAVTGR